MNLKVEKLWEGQMYCRNVLAFACRYIIHTAAFFANELGASVDMIRDKRRVIHVLFAHLQNQSTHFVVANNKIKHRALQIAFGGCTFSSTLSWGFVFGVGHTPCMGIFCTC